MALNFKSTPSSSHAWLTRMLGNNPYYARMCVQLMKQAIGPDIMATNAMAEAFVVYFLSDNLDVDGVKKRGKAKRHY